MNNLPARIIEIANLKLCQQIVENQQIIWNMPERDAIPFWKLMTLHSTGGFLVGVFDQEKIIGHAMLTQAVDPGSKENYLYLDMVGVLPDYRNCGLAEKMLVLALEHARDRAANSIQWTFDPLETANANLYIRKLGARAIRFYPDYYGSDDQDILSMTDRFWVRWEANAHVPENKLPSSIIHLDAPHRDVASDKVALELPEDFSDLKRKNPQHARRFRVHSRAIFADLFKKKYIISGFVRFNFKNYYIAYKQKSTRFGKCL